MLFGKFKKLKKYDPEVERKFREDIEAAEIKGIHVEVKQERIFVATHKKSTIRKE